jgi:hypothetical protein
MKSKYNREDDDTFYLPQAQLQIGSVFRWQRVNIAKWVFTKIRLISPQMTKKMAPIPGKRPTL